MRQKVLDRLFERLFGSPVVRNNLRGELVEEIVGMALAPEWNLCGGDWGACDLQHGKSSQKIQVKQSAAKQSWDTGSRGSSPPRFSIAKKTGRWEGADWIPGVGRNADIFIFAWHSETASDCDHAEPTQWKFYVVAETELPDQKSLGLAQIEQLTAAVDFSKLRSAVHSVMINALDVEEQLAPSAKL